MCPAHLPRDGRNEKIMKYMLRTVPPGLRLHLPVPCRPILASCRPDRSSLNPLGLTEVQKSGPLLGSRWMLVTAHLFSTTEPPLLLVNSKTYHTEVPWVEGEDSSCRWSGGGITSASNNRDSAWMFLGCNVTKRAAAVGMLREPPLSCIFRYNKVITYS